MTCSGPRVASAQSVEDPSRRFSAFSEAEKGWADAEIRMVAEIAQAARSANWQAAAGRLERRRPEDYRRRDRLEISVRQQAERLANGEGLDAT
jgi:hypothetical protein